MLSRSPGACCWRGRICFSVLDVNVDAVTHAWGECARRRRCRMLFDTWGGVTGAPALSAVLTGANAADRGAFERRVPHVAGGRCRCCAQRRRDVGASRQRNRGALGLGVDWQMILPPRVPPPDPAITLQATLIHCC